MADRMIDPRLARRANADAIDAGLSTPPRLSVEQVAGRVTADCGGAPASMSWSPSSAHCWRRTGHAAWL